MRPFLFTQMSEQIGWHPLHDIEGSATHFQKSNLKRGPEAKRITVPGQYRASLRGLQGKEMSDLEL
jgi:hypothetical protein